MSIHFSAPEFDCQPGKVRIFGAASLEKTGF